MTIDFSNSCSFILGPNPQSEVDIQELKVQLEKGTDEVRIEALKAVLHLLSSGHKKSATSLLMTIIRFVLPNQKNKLLKKLVLLFFELIPKTDADGNLLSEMILLCNALRNDLQHPNEYVRGVTLRFLTHIREAEILEPLIAAVRACLEHNHPYVRRNAIVAIFSIYQSNDFLVPDAGELLHKLLITETDFSCMRNAFAFLSRLDRELSWDFFKGLGERIASLDSALQLSIIEFIKNESTTDNDCPPEKLSYYTKSVISLLQSMSSIVKFEAASALMSLSTAPAVIKAVANTYVDLAVRETDNNAKLMVMDRYAMLQMTHRQIIDDDVLEVLRVLVAPDLAVRQRAIEILSEGVTARHSDELVAALIKELGKLADYDESSEYRRSLLIAIEKCSTKFPSIAPTALSCFFELLNNPSLDQESLAVIVKFTKEILDYNPSLRASSLHRLFEIMEQQVEGSIVASMLWVIGEYSEGEETLRQSFESLKALIGELPIVRPEEKDESQTTEDTNMGLKKMESKLVLNPDGTYASESALTFSNKPRHRDSNTPVLREFIVNEDKSVAISLGLCLAKIVARAHQLHMKDYNIIQSTSMLIITSEIKIFLSSPKSYSLDKDTYERLMLYLKSLAKPIPSLIEALIIDSRKALELYLSSTMKSSLNGNDRQADEKINFRLVNRSQSLKRIPSDSYEKDLTIAISPSGNGGSSGIANNNNLLSRVIQLTGYSDDIYAETYVTISGSDILLDVLVVNQKDKLLQNVSVDLCTSGDLSITEKPVPFLLNANGFSVVKAALKVKSTDSSLVFGNISYGVTDVKTILLNTININVSEYIKPLIIEEDQFRSLWPTLEWENKIVVPAIPASSSLKSVLTCLLKEANLYCITDRFGINDTEDYLAANLHAISTFGEEILANICLERSNEGISGHLRLRSKTQGIAVALGDRITEIVDRLVNSKSKNLL